MLFYYILSRLYLLSLKVRQKNTLTSDALPLPTGCNRRYLRNRSLLQVLFQKAWHTSANVQST